MGHVRTIRAITSPLGPRKGRPRWWAYSYEDLAVLLEMTPAQVRRAVRLGRFDPASLADVVRYVNAKGRR